MPSLAEVDAFPIPDMLVPRIIKEHKTCPCCAEAAVREMKRMLYLHALSGEPVSPSEAIDPAWHEMLAFTRFYQDFAHFIGVFVHHDPTPGPPDGGNMYKRTKILYQQHFGIEPDPSMWP